MHFFGNSLTKGTLGIGFSRYLTTPPHTQIHIHGVDGDTMLGVTHRVIRYLNRISNSRKNQRIVVLECGSNDLLLPYMEHVHPDWSQAVQTMIKPGREPLHEIPDFIDSFRAKLVQIHALLRAEADDTMYPAVMTLPLLGEQLDSWLNTRRRQLNEAIHTLCNSLGIYCIDPASAMEKAVISAVKQAGIGDSFFPSQTDPGIFQRDRISINGNPKTADSISEKRGLAVTTDGLHCNSRGAVIIADEVNTFFRNILTS